MSTAAAQAGGKLLEAALRTVPNLPVWVGYPRSLTPPAVVLAPPRLEWAGFCASGPTQARWFVYLVSAMNEFTVGQLLELVDPVVAAIDEHVPGAVVTTADPVPYPAGPELAAYQIQIEMELS